MRPANAPSVGECSPGPRGAGIDRGEAWASQVTGSSSSRVPWSYTPPGAASTHPLTVETAIAFEENGALGTRNVHRFRGRIPTAHALACLRFAGRVAATVARLATGSGGLTPGRAGFAPAGRRTGFHDVIVFIAPSRPAVPGRTVCSMLLSGGYFAGGPTKSRAQGATTMPRAPAR